MESHLRRLALPLTERDTARVSCSAVAAVSISLPEYGHAEPSTAGIT